MRAVAVIGPGHSGKSTLIDGMARAEGAKPATLQMTSGASVTPYSYMGDAWTAIEAPGGRDALALAGPILAACDAAVLCVPAQSDAAVLAAPYLRLLEESGIPTFLFLNKIDVATERVAEIVAALQDFCAHGIVLRQIPIREAGTVTGVIDLISERASEYHEGRRSSLIELPADMLDREQGARADLLEALADYDDALLEQIIEDKTPDARDVYPVSTRVLKRHELIPTFIGAASHSNGLHHLLKTLRHEVPGVAALRQRLGLGDDVRTAACLGDQLKHLGKLTVLRALTDGVAPRDRLGGETVGALSQLDLKSPISPALAAGAFAVAIKADHLSPGYVQTEEDARALPDWAAAPPPALSRLVHPTHERDETKLSKALERLAEIDPGLTVTQDPDSGAPLIGLQGQQHLKTVLATLSGVFGIEVSCEETGASLRETIRGRTTVHHRHRKQSGGAGQFADVILTVSPRTSGSGFAFSDSVKGGTVPRNYIPAVEAGAREALRAGPAGYRVVDIAVELEDGKSHSVDSSDFAFRTAGQNAVKEALTESGTKILQPILRAEIRAPSVFEGNLVQLVSGLKGQVLGFEPDGTAAGWDVFRALLPAAAEEELSHGLASATRGTALFTTALDHYEQVSAPALARAT